MNVNHQVLVEFVDVQKTYDGAELVIKNLNLKIPRKYKGAKNQYNIYYIFNSILIYNVCSIHLI